MASVRVRPDNGLFFFDFRFQGVRCREHTTLKSTKSNRTRMEKVLAKIELAIAEGKFDYEQFFPGSAKAIQFKKEHQSGNVTRISANEALTSVKANDIDSPLFQDFAEVWLSENKPLWRQRTIIAAEQHLRKHLLPLLSDKPVHTIDKATILSFRTDISNGVTSGKKITNKTINEVLNVLLPLMREAADRFDFKDPTIGVQRLKLQKSHVEPLNLVEVGSFLNAVRSDYYDYFVVRFFTGMRTGEIHGLLWENVDFERRQILVRETFADGITEYTKNDGSQREIEMSSNVYEALRRLHLATSKISNYVFCNPDGLPLNAQNINRRIWKPTLRLCGLKTRRLYQTRHTTATLWLASGENPEWIARQMGHTNTSMLFSVYSRYVPNLTRRDGSAFEALIQTEFKEV